jgi:hypothetical protein
MNATFHFTPKLLRTGELKDAFELALKEILGENAQIKVGHRRPPRRPGVEEDPVWLEADSLRALCDLSALDVVLSAKREGSAFREIYLAIMPAFRGGSFRIYASGEESLECVEKMAAILGLAESAAFEDPADSLESRVSAAERILAKQGQRLRSFISFKFDDPRTALQSNILKRLLAALEVDWVSGEQFEPRRIEDKVKARLRADVDFLIAIISKAGESKWIRDELSDANARGIWIILLLEEGATFDKGIFGTLEYISYEITIEQTFPALVEGINFVRAELTARSARPPNQSGGA